MAHASDEAQREYNREYQRQRRSDPKFQANERRLNRLAWRRNNHSDARDVELSGRNLAFQSLRDSGISCTKIAAMLGVHVSTVLRNTSRATPEGKG